MQPHTAVPICYNMRSQGLEVTAQRTLAFVVPAGTPDGSGGMCLGCVLCAVVCMVCIISEWKPAQRGRERGRERGVSEAGQSLLFFFSFLAFLLFFSPSSSSAFLFFFFLFFSSLRRSSASSALLPPRMHLISFLE